MMDIYFQKEYGIINESIECGKAINKIIYTDYGTISHMFILRKVPIDIENEQYYDIVTPYGYGGPVFIECETGKKEFLLREYEHKFNEYCKENNIVSEFVRFHPLVGNGADFKSVYHSKCIRKTVGTNLTNSNDPIQTEFSKSCKKRIRRALRDGITYRIIQEPQEIEEFKKIYYSTMKRNQAESFYYFTDAYFNKCLSYFRKNIILTEALFKDRVIAAGFYFIWDKVIHIHLSGTFSEYLYLSPAYILRYAVALWGKQRGYQLIHHGGGRTNEPEDGLYQFKRQFGQNTLFDFYIGKRIWNEKVYQRLCDKRRIVPDDTGYFPSYRQ